MTGPVIVSGVKPANANERVSMMAPAGMPKCETCRPYYKASSDRNGGWCQHPDNRTAPSSGWPTGFTPSQTWDGSCTLHPERAAKLPQRLSNWPFPSSDPAERDRMARDHQRQQRAAVVDGEESPL